MTIRKNFISISAAALLSGAAQAEAEEAGSYSQIAFLITDYTRMDHVEAPVIFGPSEGAAVITATSGPPFPEGGHSLVKCLTVGRQFPDKLDIEAVCTTTASSGDKLFLSAERQTSGSDSSADGIGKLEILGGTGAFDGMSGSCDYTIKNLRSNWQVSQLDCSWQQ